MIQKGFGDDCIGRTKVYKCLKLFQTGCENLNEGERPRPPEESYCAELMEKWWEIIPVNGNFIVKSLLKNRVRLVIRFEQINWRLG